MRTYKKCISLVLVLILCISIIFNPLAVSKAYAEEGDVAINATNFPDENFRIYIREELDKNADNILSEEEISEITKIEVSEKNIASLKGIEFFTNLWDLSCSNNQLTSLDVSENTYLWNLYCYNNQLTSLDVSENIWLENLYCYNNQLTSLDISKNTELRKLSLWGNNISTIDISNCSFLKWVVKDGAVEASENYISYTFFKDEGPKTRPTDLSLTIDVTTNVVANDEVLITGVVKNGLTKDSDGKTRLYKDGKVNTSYNGLYEKEPGSNVFYGLKEGVWVENWEGLYLHSSNGRYYFLKDGVWQRGLDTLYKHSLNGKWYYLKNGIWQKGYLGLWQNPNDNGRYYYLNNGLWQKGYDGLYVHSKNQWTYYLRDGIWNRVTEWYKHSQNGQTYYIEIGLWRGTYKDRNGVQKKSTSVVVPK